MPPPIFPQTPSSTAEMVTTAELPAEYVIPGALSDPAAVLGKVSEGKILPGEQLFAAKLIVAGGSDSKTLSYAIQAGMRAVTIAVNQISGVSYLIAPGNHVDFIGQFVVEYKQAAETVKISYTVMILEDIKVLAVDNVLGKNGKLASESPAYTALTLEVTPAQAMDLSMAQFEGELKAVFRTPVDHGTTNQPTLTLDDILR